MHKILQDFERENDIMTSKQVRLLDFESAVIRSSVE